MYKEDLIYSLSPAIWAEESFGFKLDSWQANVLQSQRRQIIMLCSRQSGKSTVAALKCLHRAVYYPNSLVLVVSKAERQSFEVFGKISSYYDRLKSPPTKIKDQALSFTLSNGSRVVSLPGAEDTIRGYSAVDLLFEDESARVPDVLNDAVRPMLAVSNGQLILGSTPNGTNGHFARAWLEGGDSWERYKITATMCPRISAEFLAEEKKNMLAPIYDQEYFCSFKAVEGAVFSSDFFRTLIDPTIKPLPFKICGDAI